MSAPAPDAEISPFRWWILLGLWAAAVMEVLDTTIVNVALPQMAGNLSATPTEIAWVSTGYILSNVVVLPMTAFLAGRFGRKRYLTFSILLFVVASFFCGTAHSLGELVLWRILQGAGGAALLSTAQATLREIFPRDQQGMVQAIFMIGIVVAPTLGPTLGGWITDNYTWGWVFYVNIPIGAFSLFLVSTFLEDSRYANPMARRTPDWIGIALLTLGIGSLQYVLEEGNKDDWFESALIVRLSLVAAASLIGMVWWQLSPRNPNPVVDFRILKNRSLTITLGLFLALGFGLYGGLFLYPLFTQSVLQLTPTETGLSLLPGGIATIAGVLICGRLLNGPKALVDPRILIFIGVGLFSLSMWDLGHLTTQTGSDDLTVALIVRGLGLGFLFTPINLLAFASVPPRDIQQASGLINLTRQMGGSFGIAILGTYLSNQTHFHQAMLAEHLTAGNAELAVREQAIAAHLITQGTAPAVAQGAALGSLAQTVATQAQTMAYNDAFLLILLSFAVASPAVLLLKRGAAQPVSAGH